MLIAFTAMADTIHLKNGSVIKGKVASYGDDQFVVVLDTGSSRYMSRAMIFIGDVARIEFDSAPTGSSDNTTPRNRGQFFEPRESRETPPIVIQPRESQQRETVGRTTKIADTHPRETPPAETQPVSSPSREPVKEPEASRFHIYESARSGTASQKADWRRQDRQRRRRGEARLDQHRIDRQARRPDSDYRKRKITMDPASQQSSGPEGTDLPTLAS